MKFLTGVVMFCPLISASVFNTPEVTAVADASRLQPQGWSPRPTEAPNFKELLKRQSSDTLSLIEGPDLICGYQFGDPDGGLALCGQISRCGFATAPGQSGDIFCYGTITSEPRPSWTSCVGGIYASSCLADSACKRNTDVVVCTDTAEPYCNAGTFVGLGVEAVWCDSTYYTDTDLIPVYTTYAGQAGRVFTTPSETSAQTTESTSPTSTTASTSTSTSTPTSTSTSTTPSPPVIPPPVPTHHTPIGPIVGGVIGGLALIAGIAAGIFFCLRSKRKDGQATNEISSPPPEVQSYPQNNNTYPQYQSEKYPATAQAKFIPHSMSPQPEQQGQHQQPHYQPQYQLPPQVIQPSYNAFTPPQQQLPQPTRNDVEQQQPVQQPQHFSPQISQVQSQDSKIQPQPQHSHELLSGVYRDSVVSTTTSSPGSPAPTYTSTVLTVPEMTGESSHHVYPIDHRHEMQS